MITDFTWTRYDGTCNKREAITSMMIKKRGNETMKKKVITALTTACLVATLFSGCGQKEVTNGQADNQSNSATAEESSATSEELSAQATNMNELVGQFQLRE